ncbi:MAG: tetratricopeptide repeat protein [Bacteroidia bacterium]
MTKKTLLLLFIFLGTHQFVFSQEKMKITPKKANEYFDNGDFEDALDAYISLLDKDPKNEKYNYRIAVCYLNTNIDKSKAIPYLEIVTRMEKYDPDAEYLLGRAYHFAYRFDDAIKAYNAYKKEGKGTPDNLNDVDREIQYCLNAKELIKFPVDVSFENLGPNVNSAYADYYPFIPGNESFLVFNSKRPNENENRSANGLYIPKICISKVTKGQFSTSEIMPAPLNNDDGNNEVIGLSSSGNTMLLYHINLKGEGDIFVSGSDVNRQFSKPEKLNENINSKSGDEIAASVTADGQKIFFASNRTGGFGGTDIYMSQKLPTGIWGPAINLGADINTTFDEDFPNISPDGKTLYFSSKGHTGMGGYDIFKAIWDEDQKKWTDVTNVGYPINTPEDNMNLRVSETGRYGYIAALRKGGYGDLDIYRVTFNNVEPKYSVIKGEIASSDATKKVSYSDVFITVTNKKTQEVYGNYVPNSNNGKYVIIVPPGNYHVDIQAQGFTDLSEDVDVLDKNSFQTEITKNVVLSPAK